MAIENLKKITCFFLLLIGDIAALGMGFVLAYFLRSEVFPHFFHFPLAPLPFADQFRVGFPIGTLIMVAIFSYEKLYTRRFSFWEETRRLFRGIFLTFILMILVIFISRSYERFSRMVIILMGMLSLGLIPFCRLYIKKLLSTLGLWDKRILIIGTTRSAEFVAREIRKNRSLGYQIQGFLSEGEEIPGRMIAEGLKILGNIDQLGELSQAHGIKDIIIVSSSIDRKRFIELVEQCEKITETIRIVPEIGSIFAAGVEIENIGDVLSLSVARNLAKPWNIVIKRAFDMTLAVVLTILSAPLLLITALAIKMDTRGPIFFTQERLPSKNGPFKMYKFRSMHLDADKKLSDYLNKHPEVRLEWQRYNKIKAHDPRITRVGKVIRRFSIDEFPQLINVLRGDISLIGPRPYMPREKDTMGAMFDLISRVKPGITGLWQVSGRNILSFRERLQLDEFYIRNWSLWLDIVIFIKTIKVLLKREGAY